MRFRCEVELGWRRPHDATARAKADPVDFLMEVYDHLDNAHGNAHADFADSPQAIIYRKMDDICRADLGAAGITVTTPRLGWMLR